MDRIFWNFFFPNPDRFPKSGHKISARKISTYTKYPYTLSQYLDTLKCCRRWHIRKKIAAAGREAMLIALC